ncbi:MAG: NRDE family protein, partial [Gammaproteobacteria bacterium]|nr:NRDE family protein [Gammaproteobacteria bacterium]
LTLDFLRAGQPAEKFIRELTPAAGDYAGFNLLCGDSDGLYYFSNAGGGYRELQAGIFGLSNAHLDTPWPKVRLAKQRLETLLAQTEIDPQTAMSILHDPHTAADEALPDTGISLEWERQLSAQFIRIDGYGTRCTSVLLQENSGRTVFFEQEFNQQGPGGQRLKVFSPKACPDLQK